MSHPAQAPEHFVPFELKGSALTLMVLSLRERNSDVLASHLARKFARSPGFFRNAPLVLDLGTLSEPDAPIDFPALISTLRGLNFVPVAVRGGSATQQEAAVAAGLGILAEGRAPGAESPAPPAPSCIPAADAPAPSPLKVVTQPVRSGQRIVAEGDLVVLAPISAGSELVAEGSIHVYGPLRGRALAGARGDAAARIFALQFAPELVAVAGEYLVNEELEPTLMGKSVQIFLEGDRLKAEPF